MNLRSKLRIRNDLAREFLAEFIGTFILVTCAVASGAQYVLSRGTLSTFLTVNIAGGMGLTLGIYWAGGVSGACLNPAVTLGLCLRGVIRWQKLPLYALAELCGAFVAAAVLFGIYHDAINAFDGGVRVTDPALPNATAGIFSTFPAPFASTLTCFFDQVFGTFVLIGCILAITDKCNMAPDKGLAPIALGMIVVLIGTTLALNCGYAINPARDLGPRIFTALAGWGVEPFSYRNYNWFWVPIVGPMVGAVVAWVVYELTIALHWSEEDDLQAMKDLQQETVVTKAYQTEISVIGVENKCFAEENGSAFSSGASTKL